MYDIIEASLTKGAKIITWKIEGCDDSLGKLTYR